MAERIPRRHHARHPRLARRARVRPRGARDPRRRARTSNGNTCRRSSASSRPITRRATTRSTSTWRARPPPRSRAPIAGCASSRATASATTRSTSPAMTRAGVVVTNTPSSMPRPVATIALTFILALAGKLMLKDRLTRTGRWHERMDNMGMGLTGRTLGVVGAGRIGKELLRMARTFDLEAARRRSLRQRGRARLRRRAQGRPRHAAARIRLRRRDPAAQRRDAAPDRRAAVRADEADRVFHQRRRADRSSTSRR